jgi:crossover junction endodeoxyribonuclease RusA
VHLSTEAKRYKRDVAWVAKQAGMRDPSTRPIEIGSIILIPPAYRLRIDPKTLERVQVRNSTVMDLDNCLKVTLDALKGIAYVDDAQVKRIRGPIEYGEAKDHGGLIIEIYEFIPAAPPLFANPDEALA